MKLRCLLWIMLLGAPPLLALDGDPRMHDPSIVIVGDGRYYSFGTGNGLPISVSDDGWTWRCIGMLMEAVPGGRPGPEVFERDGFVRYD